MRAHWERLRAALVILFVTGLLFLAAGPFSGLAVAHNQLLKTDPAAHAALKVSPAHIQFWFVEKPDLKITKIAVKGPAGAVEIGPAHAVSEKVIATDFKGKLASGEYSVSWQTAGDDGHISKGVFSFTVAAQ